MRSEYFFDKCVSTTMTVFTKVNSSNSPASSETATGIRMEGDSGGEQSCWRCGSESSDCNSRIKQRSESYKKDSSDSDENGVRNPRKSHARWTDSYLVIMIISMIQWLLVINIVIVVISPPMLVSAIDLNPHGGFYQREGGRNEFYSASSSAQQQSDYGEDMNDMIMTCSRPTKSSRAAKYLAIKKLDIPCDMGDKKSAWCNLPGDKYPW